MPRIPTMGVRLIGALGALAAVSVGLRFAAALTLPPLPPLPDSLEGYSGESARPPMGDGERDSPPAVHRVYKSGAKSPVYVSVALVSGMNAIRAPHHYLMDADAMRVTNQAVKVTRKGEKTPFRLLEIARGHSGRAMILHWVQPPGEDPIPELLDEPDRIVSAVFLRQPLYVCDIWVAWPPRQADGAIDMKLMDMADRIDEVIKANKFGK